MRNLLSSIAIRQRDLHDADLVLQVASVEKVYKGVQLKVGL